MGTHCDGTHWGNIRAIMETQMEKRMGNDVDTITYGLKFEVEFLHLAVVSVYRFLRNVGVCICLCILGCHEVHVGLFRAWRLRV